MWKLLLLLASWAHATPAGVPVGVPAGGAAGVPAGGAGGDFRLPGGAVPRHYDLYAAYSVDPQRNFSFFGVVKILLDAETATDTIVLHAKDYDVDTSRISLEEVSPTASAAPEVTGAAADARFDFLRVSLARPLTAGRSYRLVVPFSGRLQLGLDGVYISTYNDRASGTKEYLIATQFEAISARRGFPCLDEPALKATFGVRLAHPRALRAVSNMPLERTTEDNLMEDYWPWGVMSLKLGPKEDFVWSEFAPSVPMSTYLVAWVVSRFESVLSPAHLARPAFRVWARRDALDQTEYASQIGPRVLSYYEQWFNVSYPLPKQDMVAVPDFSAGAMENWGLITYRESTLLYDRKESSLSTKANVASVVAHELAHQWFGNLVTMKWWSDLWLNEGFASYVATLGVAAVEPAWREPEARAAQQMRLVLSLDALQNSHPVSVELDDPRRISEIFDTISYMKGSLLIRMMVLFLGEDVFRDGIHSYLVKHSYGNAEQDDLWAELTAAARRAPAPPPLAAGVGVKDVMDTWTRQTGFPLLNVTRDYEGRSVALRQKRYFALESGRDVVHSWWVPLSVLEQKEAQVPEGRSQAKVEWLSADEGVENEYHYQHGAGPDEWLLFNAGMMAPYRVNYDARNWRLLTAALQAGGGESGGGEYGGGVPALSRAQLLDDAFSLAWAEQLDYGTALGLSSYLGRETELYPLEAGLAALGRIGNVLKRDPYYGAFQKYVRKLITPAYERTGGLYSKNTQDPEDLNGVKMQKLISSWACEAGVPACLQHALELFREWTEMADPDANNPIPLEQRGTVYCAAAARGGAAEWRFLLARHRAANVAAARAALLSALACTRDVWLINQLLEWSVDGGAVVRRQDAARAVAELLRTPVGFHVARDFVMYRVKELHDAFSGQPRRVGQIVKVLLGQFTLQRELDEFLKWRADNEQYLEDSKLAVDQGVESARINIRWLQRNKRLVVDKMREQAA